MKCAKCERDKSQLFGSRESSIYICCDCMYKKNFKKAIKAGIKPFIKFNTEYILLKLMDLLDVLAGVDELYIGIGIGVLLVTAVTMFIN